MRICIVSPHLDDAILSCGARILRANRDGDSVYILNIFTAGNNAADRRVEEENAAARIGAQAAFLDELDAPDRDSRYAADLNLFFGNMADVSDAYIAHIAQRMSAFFASENIDLVYAPLGAGGHIDHRIVYAAARKLQGSFAVRYYEDRPYSLWPSTLKARMNVLGLANDLPDITADELRTALTHYHDMGHMVPAEAYSAVTAGMYEAPQQTPFRAESETTQASEQDMIAIWHALSLYTSQMPRIYKDFGVFRTLSLSHDRARGGGGAYVEYVWRILPSVV